MNTNQLMVIISALCEKMNKPRFPRVDTPTMPNQWRDKIIAEAVTSSDNGKANKFAQPNDIKPKPVIEVYEWPHLKED